MQELYAGEIVPPFVEVVMRNRPRVDAVFLDERVFRAIRAVNIEFLLQESVHGGIERERIAWRPAHADLSIKIEAARTIQKQIDLRSG